MNTPPQKEESTLSQVAKDRAKKALRKKRNKVMKKGAKAVAKAAARAISVLFKAVVSFLSTLGLPTIAFVLGSILLAVVVWLLLTSVFTFGFFDNTEEDVLGDEDQVAVHEKIVEEIESSYDEGVGSAEYYRVPPALVSAIIQIYREEQQENGKSINQVIEDVVAELTPDLEYESYTNKYEWEEKTCERVEEEHEPDEEPTYTIECETNSGSEDLDPTEFMIEGKTWNRHISYSLEPSWGAWNTDNTEHGGYYKRRYYVHEVIESEVSTDFKELDDYLNSIGFKQQDKAMIEALYESTSQENMGYTEWLGTNSPGSFSHAVCTKDGEVDMAVFSSEFDDEGVFTNREQDLIDAAEKYNIDPVLFAAIALFETTRGTSDKVVNYNNPGGVYNSSKGDFYKYSSLSEGIDAMAKNLKNRYYDRGIFTIEDIGAVYAPINATNDPTGLNANWVPGITAMANQLGGLIMHCEEMTDSINAGEMPELSEGTFTSPTTGYVTSTFRSASRPDHHGVDIGAGQKNVPIVAVADGIVARSYLSSSYGHTVIITHNIDGKTYQSLYAHMTGRNVFTGNTVSKGQLLGHMGNTGRSQGIHLHFELHVGSWNTSKSNAIDPALAGVPLP
ncbi:peptidoglycan DD-metalloendopeptidase family protein [Pontibacillus halophilus]|uniref:peptidoglycan DD-metalloendopeptidase family protein n=1 Tax=Pontibacillus halophilus TaxID=516704 RepID=UPI001378093A|nr:peptidoglycan DD-metalloendopeptidase family protein [Pontibacillus halophilus]